MKIIHVATFQNGYIDGIKSVLENLIPAQRELGHEVFILNQEYNEIKTIEGERYINGRSDFIEVINDTKPDIVILHSLYGIQDVVFSRFLKSKNIPYLIEPHGGTSLENSKKSFFKKKIANFIYANKFIHDAEGIVYLNQKEADECVFKKHRKAYVVIPNGAQIHGRPKGLESKDGKVRYMFLGRLEIPHKGIDLLFPAIKQIVEKGFLEKTEFHFYGRTRNEKYTRLFQKYLKEADNNVFYHGAVDGKDKENAYKNADIFVLTSRFEGMPMAILEALSYGLPCLVTPQTNMAELIKKYNAGWITETKIDSIASSLMRACEEYNNHKEKYKINALDAVRQFDWSKIASDSIKKYTSLIKK